jgi:tripartite-type tricarboxylate transporter receptor subunit TctC
MQRGRQRNLPYDADTDLQAVVLVTVTPTLLAVTSGLQAASVKELSDLRAGIKAE